MNQNLEAELEVQQKGASRDYHQHWFLERADDGALYIFSRLNCLVVDIRANVDECGTPVILYYRKSCPLAVTNQRWRFLESGHIESVMNGQVLEIADGGAKAGQCVVTWTQRAPPGNEGQLWKLKDVDTNHSRPEMESGSSESGSADSKA